MRRICFILTALVALCMASCGSTSRTTSSKVTSEIPVLQDNQTFQITEFTKDKTYGYKENNPIKVGGALKYEGPLNERRFLNALCGPKGEVITYQRRGSCCAFKSPNGFGGTGMLDIYEIMYEGLTEPIVLYINMYDYEPLMVPIGFRLKSEFVKSKSSLPLA